MPAPTSDKVRVYANCGVGALKPQKWNDIEAYHPQLALWIENGMVSLTGPRGQTAPVDLPQSCCGSR